MSFAKWFGKGHRPLCSVHGEQMGSTTSSGFLGAVSLALRGVPHERERRRRGWCRVLGGGPAVLQGVDDGLVHGWGGVAVDAADAGQAVAESSGLGDFGDVVFDEPGLVGVA